MTEDTVKLAIERVQNRHFMMVISCVSVIGVVFTVSNTSQQALPRAGLLLVATIMLITSLVRVWRHGQSALTSALSLAGLMLIGGASAIAVDHFIEFHAALSYACVIAVGCAALGLERVVAVVGTLLASGAGFLVLNQQGLLEQIKLSAERQGSQSQSLVASTMLLVVVLCVYLMLRFQRTEMDLLRQATRTAVAAQQAESLFLSNMSHEIRNPLNGITGTLHMLASDRDTTAEQRSTIKLGLKSSEALKRIVDDILDIKSLNEGRLKILNEPFDIQVLLYALRSSYGAMARAKGLEFIMNNDVANIPRMLIGDEVRIHQVIGNLLSNAIKYTEKGEVRLGVSYLDGHLNVTVSDTGIGIKKDQLDALFDRFSQIDTGTRKRYQGTGLGLAISKHLTNAMHGDIRVQSDAGLGTRFSVSLPLLVSDMRPKNATIGSEASADPLSLAGLSALVVDDDPVNLLVINNTLQTADVDVYLAPCATKALEILDRQWIDIVVTDISMPDMDGEELLERIRERWPEKLVVAVTGNVLNDDIKRYQALGFNEVFTKPILPTRLIGSVKELVADLDLTGDDAATPDAT